MLSRQRWVFVSIGLAFGACHCPVSAELVPKLSDGGDLGDGGDHLGDGGTLGDGGNLGDGGDGGQQWDGGLVGDSGFVCLSTADCQQFANTSPTGDDDAGTGRLICLGGICQPDPCPVDY